MTDRTPTTEAGRRLVQGHFDAAAVCGMNDAALVDRILAIEDEARAPLVAALEDIRDLYTNDNIRPASFAVRAGDIAVAALSRDDRP